MGEAHAFMLLPREKRTEKAFNQIVEKHKELDAVQDHTRSQVHRVVTALQAARSLSVHQAAPCGSYEKGTTVAGKSDVDLVVVLNGIPSGGHKEWMPGVHSQLKGVLGAAFGGELAWQVSTRFALQFRLQNVEFDLLPVPSQLWGLDARAREDLVRQVAEADREWLSVAFSRKQCEFVQEVKGKWPRSTDVIRFLKRWAYEHEWPGTKPSSYLIELLVLHVIDSRLPDLPTSVMVVLDNFWELAGRSGMYVTWRDRAEPHRSIWAECPLVLDPANPTKNVAASCDMVELRKLAWSYM